MAEEPRRHFPAHFLLEIVPRRVLWWPADGEPAASPAVRWEWDEQELTEITEDVASVFFVGSCSVRRVLTLSHCSLGALCVPCGGIGPRQVR